MRKLTAVTLLAVALATGTVRGEAAGASTADVHWMTAMGTYKPGDKVATASSSIGRTGSGIVAGLQTGSLVPGEAVTLWYVIFNEPGNCTSGSGDVACGAGDLSNAATGPSVQYAAGALVGPMGRASFATGLRQGDTSGCPIASICAGLTNPDSAEVHLVVRTHGPASSDPATLHSQLTTMNGGCDAARPCVNLQGAAHAD